MIEHRIRQYCQKDVHAEEQGIYRIRSVYFDDVYNSCFYENENGVNEREKFRIRIYNGNTEHITLECKQKVNGKNHKDSCPLTKTCCEAILKGNFHADMVKNGGLSAEEQALLWKFYLKYSSKHMRGKVIVSYDRTPYVYTAGNVRITFDRHISGSSRVQDFLKPMVNSRPVMPANAHVLEVKYDEFLPNFLDNAMQLGTLRRATFSKYYMCRKFCG